MEAGGEHGQGAVHVPELSRGVARQEAQDGWQVGQRDAAEVLPRMREADGEGTREAGGTLTLEQAIGHARDVSRKAGGKCADEHRQLAEWLEELRDRRHANPGAPVEEPHEETRAELDEEVRFYWRVGVPGVMETTANRVNCEAVMGWLDRCGEIARRECAEFWQRVAEDRDSAEMEAEYWKGQVAKSLACACREGYAAGVMRFPRPEGFAEPSLLVNDVIMNLRDFHADDQRLIGELDERRGEAESYRLKLGKACDLADQIRGLME